MTEITTAHGASNRYRLPVPLAMMGARGSIPMVINAESYWRKRFAEDRRSLEERRRLGRAQALQAAQRFRSRWQGITAVWLFGLVLGSGFREHSDLDLLVQGLPPEALIEAIGLAEAEGPLAVDLKRVEDLAPEMRSRLLRHSRSLPIAAQAGGSDAA